MSRMLIEFPLLFVCACLFVYFAVDLHIELNVPRFKGSILFYKLDGRTLLEWYKINLFYFGTFYVAYCLHYGFLLLSKSTQTCIAQFGAALLGGVVVGMLM